MPTPTSVPKAASEKTKEIPATVNGPKDTSESIRRSDGTGGGGQALPIPDKGELNVPQLGFPSRRTGGQRGSGTGHGRGGRRGYPGAFRGICGRDHLPVRERGRRGELPCKTTAARPATWAGTTSRPTCWCPCWGRSRNSPASSGCGQSSRPSRAAAARQPSANPLRDALPAPAYQTL